ncbi:UNVERIFIED_CONTAM: hypothetical protein K2H54_029878 [Gekko kuhli]
MTSGIHMPAPMCLIENKENNFIVCPEALQVLSKINQPVVVVAIAGLYRTGKSYLMNKLAGENKGFLMGSTVQATTKGIWMWCVPYPGRPDQTLVLLDTEGLGDAKKGDAQNDSWIFALAILLSSTLVYNSMGTINQHAMDQLQSSTERNPEGLEDSAEYVRFFPTFIWALRDFALQLELNGQPCTEDEYLEDVLKLKKLKKEDKVASEPTDNFESEESFASCPVPPDTDDNKQYNLPRECIRMFFPTRKCFIFDRPTNRKNLHQLEGMEESKLEPDFVEQAKQFCNHIYETSKVKTVPGGNIVTGSMLAKLVEIYVDTIRSGGVPCAESAVEALARAENSAALNEATTRYVKLMEQKVKLPTESVQELLEMHMECETEAHKVFMARAFKKDIEQFLIELVKTLRQKKEEYCQKNELVSSKLCKSVLTPLCKKLEDGINQGIYLKSGGYQHFLDDLNKIKEQYNKKNGKGIMAEKVLQQFLKEKATVGRNILQSDEALTNAEKELEDATAKAEEAEKEKEVQKQEQAVLQQKLSDQRRSFEASIHQLEAKLEKDREELLKENEMMMECKLREQKKCLEEEQQHYTDRLQMEINHLMQEIQCTKSSSWIFSTVLVFIKAFISIFPELLQFISQVVRR